MSNYKLGTKCIQSGYSPKNGEPRILPIYQSTTYAYDSADTLGELFDLKVEGHMYSRISNPTVACVEAKIADLEGGVGAMCTSSGQAASLLAVLNIASEGQNILVSSAIYGGTLNLFAVTLKRLGIEARFFTPELTDEEVQSLIDDKTRLVFGETVANPVLKVFDIERYAKIAHKNKIPLIVDNTFATPIFCRPFEFGCDIVIHSTTKYMDGHAAVIGGVIVDSGKFDWEGSCKYPELTEPDESYHGVVYTENFKEAAYITKARVQLMRDLGSTPQPMAAFLLNLGLETLELRMERHYSNALKTADFLKNDSRISWVNYPMLKDSDQYELASKYLKGCGGVISFGIKGGREAAVEFMDSLELIKIVVHVADSRTSVLHPASTTHRQLTSQQLTDAGIGEDLIRLSVGTEDSEDIIADIKQALDKLD
ncbi:MAG: O-acetylhomoserine aminocarboxypropyltransferase/cysteine synthase family protein [Candidatus Metalachnospira sp.]|nr:O-acetylhomoserine aminocarboxypropyltransferase/cysteine synthase family protein [Candidatus Metalachnospira sp.]